MGNVLGSSVPEHELRPRDDLAARRMSDEIVRESGVTLVNSSTGCIIHSPEFRAGCRMCAAKWLEGVPTKADSFSDED